MIVVTGSLLYSDVVGNRPVWLGFYGGGVRGEYPIPQMLRHVNSYKIFWVIWAANNQPAIKPSICHSMTSPGATMLQVRFGLTSQHLDEPKVSSGLLNLRTTQFERVVRREHEHERDCEENSNQ